MFLKEPAEICCWSKIKHIFRPLLVLLIFVQSFEGICVVVFAFGFCYEAWMSIIWTLIYDLFPGSDASDALGILTFCWGIASFFVSILETLILGVTRNDSSSSSPSKNVSTTVDSVIEASSSASAEPLMTTFMNGSPSKNADA